MTLDCRIELVDAQTHVQVKDHDDTVLVIAENEAAANAILVPALALLEVCIIHGHSRTEKARKALFRAKEDVSEAMQVFAGAAVVKIDVAHGHEISIFHSGNGNDR